MCKAAVAWVAAQPLTLEEITVAPPKQGEVRVKASDGVVSRISYNNYAAVFWKTIRIFGLGGQPRIFGFGGPHIRPQILNSLFLTQF